MKNGQASYKHKIAFAKKWLDTYRTVYRRVPFFILSHFSYKQSIRDHIVSSSDHKVAWPDFQVLGAGYDRCYNY